MTEALLALLVLTVGVAGAALVGSGVWTGLGRSLAHLPIERRKGAAVGGALALTFIVVGIVVLTLVAG